MAQHDLQTQQRDWLTSAYPGLFGLAAAITRNPQISEEVVSSAVVSALEQIHQGTCLATTKGQLFAWIRTIVRNKAKSSIGAGRDRGKRFSLVAGDLLRDRAAEQVINEPDADSFRRGVKRNLDQLETGNNPYFRTETV